MDNNFFRTLNADEEQTFRQWARDNWKPGDEINALWHPVVRDEIAKISVENAPFVLWARERGYPTTASELTQEMLMHWHYDTGTGDPGDWVGVPESWGEFNNWRYPGEVS